MGWWVWVRGGLGMGWCCDTHGFTHVLPYHLALVLVPLVSSSFAAPFLSLHGSSLSFHHSFSTMDDPTQEACPNFTAAAFNGIRLAMIHQQTSLLLARAGLDWTETQLLQQGT